MMKPSESASQVRGDHSAMEGQRNHNYTYSEEKPGHPPRAHTLEED